MVPSDIIALCKTLVPNWSEIGEDKFSFRRCVSTSNSVYHVSVNVDTSPKDLIYRVIGPGEVIDKAQELRVCSKLSELNLVPRILYLDDVQRVEEYLDGFTPLVRLDIADPSKIKLITEQLRSLHAADMSSALDPSVSNTVKYASKWRALTKDIFPEEEFSAEEHWANYLKLQPLLGETVFCHCDMSDMNILYNPVSGQLKLIDYEFSGYAPISTDLAFIVNEILFEYDIKVPPYFEYYPEAPATDALVANYVNSYGGGADLWVQVQLSRLASHYFWALWAAAKALKADPDGFNYLEFARLRFSLYKEWQSSLDLEELRGRAESLFSSS